MSLFNFCWVNIGTKMIAIALLSRLICRKFRLYAIMYARYAAQRLAYLLLINRYVCVLNINHYSFVQQNHIDNDELLNDTIYMVLDSNVYCCICACRYIHYIGTHIARCIYKTRGSARLI